MILIGGKNTNINKVTVVNALNPTGLKYNEREFVSEEEPETNDLNRYFDTTNYPTKEGIMCELEEVMKDVDIVVDVHNSPNILPCISIALNVNAAPYVDFAIRNDIKFVLAGNVSTIKRHADMDLNKIAFTYEFSGMNFDVRADINNQLKMDCLTFEKLLKSIGKSENFREIFKRRESHTFFKMCTNYNLSLINLYGKKYFSLPTYAEGIYSWARGNPLGHYTKGEQIVIIENPVDGSLQQEIRAPCDGILVDVDNSWWACEDGSLGDFQPDLESDVFDYYKEKLKEERKTQES